MQHFRNTCLSLAALVGLAGAAFAAVPAGLKGAGADADKWVMDNSDFVLTINVKQLAGSAVMTRDGGKDFLKEMVKAEPKVEAALEAVGVNPLTDIDSILFSGSVGSKVSDAKGAVIIKGRFDPDKALEGIKTKAKHAELVKEDGATLIKLKLKDHNAYAAFLGKNTLAVTQDKASTLAWVKGGGKAEAKMSRALTTALGSFKGTETLTFAMVLNEEARKRLGEVPQLAVAGPKLQAVTASVNVTDQADVKVVASTTEVKAAQQLQRAMTVLKGLGEVMVSSEDSYGPLVAGVLNEVKISLDGTSVQLNLKVDKALLEKASKKKN